MVLDDHPSASWEIPCIWRSHDGKVFSKVWVLWYHALISVKPRVVDWMSRESASVHALLYWVCWC